MSYKKFLLTFLALASMLAFVVAPAPVQADEATQIVWINSPISSQLRFVLDNFLASENPANTQYYAVTYSQPKGQGYYVSLAGLNIQSPEDPWSLTGIESIDQNGNRQYTNQVLWWETILVDENGQVSYPFRNVQARKNISGVGYSAFGTLLHDRFSPLRAGGGSFVRFPWEPSKTMKFGLLGVHGAGPLADESGEWRAIDLESGSDMGPSAASDKVYASVAGDVEAVCSDGTSVAIRTGGDEKFIYANMQENGNLEIDHSFSSGGYIGKLLHGSFNGTCGNALQQAQRWTLKWGFVIQDNSFKAEGCSLTNPPGAPKWAWHCGNITINPLGALQHYGNVVTTGGDPGTVDSHILGEWGQGGGPSFWDYLVIGISDIFNSLFLNSLPEHSSNINQLFDVILTGVKIVIRVAYVLLKGNLNLFPAAKVILLTIGIVLALRVVAVVVYIYRMIKALPFF